MSECVCECVHACVCVLYPCLSDRQSLASRPRCSEKVQNYRTYRLPLGGGELQDEGFHVQHEDLVVEADNGVILSIGHVHMAEHLRKERQKATI